MIRILYDGQMFGMQKAGGINRYFAELISKLPDDITPVISLFHNRSIFFPDHKNLVVHSYPFSQSNPRRLWNFLAPYHATLLEKLSNAQLFHPTFYKGLSQRERMKNGCPMIVTVWDILHLKFSSQLDPNGEWGSQIKRTIESADALLCISSSTKRDVLEHFNIDDSKITVTPLAASLGNERSNLTRSPICDAPFFLFVGARAGYKNFSIALAAFKQVRNSIKDCKLCVAGELFSGPELAEIESLGIQHAVLLFEHPQDDVLTQLYRESVALIYPSQYEGFGLPALEALNCGTTVIATNSSSVPEVVGDAGILLDRVDASTLADAMIHLARDGAERALLVGRGKARAKLFSWETVVKETVQVYRALAN